MPVTAQAFLDMREENARNHLQEHVEALRKKGLTARRKLHAADPAAMIAKATENMDMDFNHPIHAWTQRNGSVLGAQCSAESGAKNKDTPITDPTFGK